MCRLVFLLAICLTSVVALQQERIAGGAIVTLAEHPYTAAVLYAQNSVNFRQICGGAIINNRSILSAVYCFIGSNNHPNNYRVRISSVNASSGGLLYGVAELISHPNYNSWNQDNNIGILRVTTIINFGTNARPVRIAGPNYNLVDNESVWAIGWGQITVSGVNSEQLRRVQLVTVNQGKCIDIYGIGFVTPNMLCAGWPVAGRGSCIADTGSPLLHNNVAVGITSLGIGCGDANFPSIYIRISRYNNWIQNNA